MKKEFNILCDALEKKNLKTTVKLSNPFGDETIDIIIGIDAPDNFVEKVFNVLEDTGIEADVSGDASFLNLIETRTTNGGHKRRW